MTQPPSNLLHPGQVLEREFLRRLKITQYRLAKDISVPPRRINEIVHGLRGITPDTALRLARYFETTPEFWMNLQARYDLDFQASRLAGRLKSEVKIFSSASALA